MFVELMPLLAGRTVLITVAKVDDKTLRVNVIPHAKADENPALSTPLTYTGPPEELDAELGKHLAGYVQTHQQTASTLAEAKATLEAAAKAAQEEAKRKADERKKVTQKAPAPVTADASSAASSTPAEPAPSSTSTGTLGLFSTSTPEPAPTQSKGGLALQWRPTYFPASSNSMVCGFPTRIPNSRSRRSAASTHTSIPTSPRRQSPGRRRSETSWCIASRAPSAQRDDQ